MKDHKIAPLLYSVRVGAIRGKKHRFPGGTFVTRGFDLAMRTAEGYDKPAIVVEVDGDTMAEAVAWKNDAWKSST